MDEATGLKNGHMTSAFQTPMNCFFCLESVGTTNELHTAACRYFGACALFFPHYFWCLRGGWSRHAGTPKNTLQNCLHTKKKTMGEEEASSITIQDAPPRAPVITAAVLRAARERRDVRFPDYSGFSVSFVESATPLPQHVPLKQPDKIADSVFELIGRTPMVRLSRLAQKYGLQCDLVAKCEFLSAGGSVKDRIGLLMVEEAESNGTLRPGSTIVEATSGNTGIGIGLVAAVKGYNMVITLPEKMSQEKVTTMTALGAEVVRSPMDVPGASLDSHIGLAHRLREVIPGAVTLDQYKNPANPRAHYLYTAEEILYQCDNRVDMVVVAAGTGGTLTGVGTKLKERLPQCRVVGVDPRGSILAEPSELNVECLGRPYLVEGIGYDFVPSTLHRKVVDAWVKVNDSESFRMARELIRVEGLLVGGSSGSAVAGAIKAARTLQSGQTCVVILPDASRNYMTKFMSDDWMVDQGFYAPPPAVPSAFGDRTVRDLGLPLSAPCWVDHDASCSDAIRAMREKHVRHLIVAAPGTRTVAYGVVTDKALLKAFATGRATRADPVAPLATRKFKMITDTWKIADVARTLVLSHYCVVGTKDAVRGIITDMDLCQALL